MFTLSWHSKEETIPGNLVEEAMVLNGFSTARVSPLCACPPDGCVSGRVEEAMALHVCRNLLALSKASVSPLYTCPPDDCVSLLVALSGDYISFFLLAGIQDNLRDDKRQLKRKCVLGYQSRGTSPYHSRESCSKQQAWQPEQDTERWCPD